MNDKYLDINHPTSCNIEDAVLYLLGFKYAELQPVWVNGEFIGHHGLHMLADDVDEAYAALSEAKYDSSPEALIQQRQFDYDNALSKKKLAHQYRCAIAEELSSSQPILLEDVTTSAAVSFITFVSLKRWAKEVYGMDILEEILPAALGVKLSKEKYSASQVKMPWEEHQKGDPDPEQTWYISARYFARQAIKDKQIKILTKQKLSILVESLMAKNGIKQKNGKAYQADTIRKAFRNIRFTI